MLEKDKMARINELANKAKSEGLTAAEKEEQVALRQEYLRVFRGQFENHLHGVTVIDMEGNDVTPEKLKKSKAKRQQQKKEKTTKDETE